jgi:hypothetical protein
MTLEFACDHGALVVNDRVHRAAGGAPVARVPAGERDAPGRNRTCDPLLRSPVHPVHHTIPHH